jgi:hypothetical protein
MKQALLAFEQALVDAAQAAKEAKANAKADARRKEESEKLSRRLARQTAKPHETHHTSCRLTSVLQEPTLATGTASSHTMIEKSQSSDTTTPPPSDWEHLEHEHPRGPTPEHWMIASSLAAGVMLYVSPMAHSSVLNGAAAVLLSPLIFLFGYIAGWMYSSSLYREPFRKHFTWPFVIVPPVIVAATLGLSFLGGRYWWPFSFTLAFLGYRKGRKRMRTLHR